MDMESLAYTNHHGGIVTHIEGGVHVIPLEIGEHHRHHHIVGTHHIYHVCERLFLVPSVLTKRLRRILYMCGTLQKFTIVYA
jgi:hypothetical protein